MIRSDSIFYALSDKECEAVSMTEGVVFVCALQSSLGNIINSHIRFLNEVQKVPMDNISLCFNDSWNCKYAIVNLELEVSYRELVEFIDVSRIKGTNVYCIGTSSNWKLLCNNVPISFIDDGLHPNVAIDCTGHKPYFYRHRSKEDVLKARLFLSDMLSALASRKPPVLLFTETEQDNNYVELFKGQHGNRGVIYMDRPPNDTSLLGTSKVITILNSGNQESVAGLLQFVNNIQSPEKLHVILYSFYSINRILQAKLEYFDIPYTSIVPSRNLGILSINAISLDIKRQIMETLDNLINE